MRAELCRKKNLPHLIVVGQIAERGSCTRHNLLERESRVRVEHRQIGGPVIVYKIGTWDSYMVLAGIWWMLRLWDGS